MATPATIQVTPGIGLFLDAVQVVVSGQPVLRETMVIADPTSPTQLVSVTAGGALKIDGSATVQPVSISGSVPVTGPISVTQGTSPWVVSNGGTFAVQASITTLGQQLAAASVPVVLTAAQLTTLTPPTTVAVTQSTSPWVVSLTSTTITGTVGVTQSTNPWTIQGDSASGAAKAGNPVQIGGVFNTSQPTVTAGQTVEAQMTARGAQIVATGADVFNVAINAALPAGTNVIGHVITDSGSTTAVTGNVTVTQATAINLNAAVVPGLPTTGATTKTNVTTSASGWTNLVSGVGGQTIRLWRLIISVNAATNIGLGDGTTIFEGPYYLQAGGSIVFDISGEPWYVGAVAAALQINSSNAVSVSATVWTTQS